MFFDNYSCYVGINWLVKHLYNNELIYCSFLRFLISSRITEAFS